jgi:hypothetical protein
MNLDDLRRELRSRAAEPGSTSMDDRLVGVRTKVVAARRRKVATTSVAALASLAVIGVTLGQVVAGDDGGEVAGGTFVPLPDQLNGDLLIDDAYNEPGASQLRWDVELDNLGVLAKTTCQIPEGTDLPSPDIPVLLWWSIDGTEVGGAECGDAGSAALRTDGPASRADWREYGVRRDEPFEIEAWLMQAGDRVEIPDARFGIGLYDKADDRVRKAGVELPNLLDVDGERYRLADYKIRSLGSGNRLLRLRLPESTEPVAVMYGWHSDQPAASFTLRRDREPLRSGYGGAVEGPIMVDADSSLLRLRAAGSSAEGALVLAYYELDD